MEKKDGRICGESFDYLSASQPRSKIYMDNAATTRMRPDAVDAYVAACTNAYGNPSSLHAEGRNAHDVLEWARDVFAKSLAVPSDSVYFTSCGTESNNIALRGVFSSINTRDPARNVIVTSAVEHSSVRKTAGLIDGAVHVQVPVDSDGFVTTEEFRRVLSEHAGSVALVSIIMAQNEVGSIQPITELAAITRDIIGAGVVAFHTDATQAFGKMRVEPQALGVDLLTASAHKFHGPRGVGLLYARPGLLDPAYTPMSGGGQERGCRSGTENVPAIAAAAVALLASASCTDDAFRMHRVSKMRDDIAAILKMNIPGTRINGDPSRGLPGMISVSLPGINATFATTLDSFGLAVGTGSACSKGKPSETLLAMGRSPQEALATIRISLCEYNTPQEVQEAIVTIVKCWRRVMYASKQ